MIMSGCQGKPQISINEKKCPNCGAEIEIFSIDTQMVCEKCGFTIYNDSLSCVQWCKYSKECVGEEMYNHMMEIAARQKAEREAARAAEAEGEAPEAAGSSGR